MGNCSGLHEERPCAGAIADQHCHQRCRREGTAPAADTGERQRGLCGQYGARLAGEQQKRGRFILCIDEATRAHLSTVQTIASISLFALLHWGKCETLAGTRAPSTHAAFHQQVFEGGHLTNFSRNPHRSNGAPSRVDWTSGTPKGRTIFGEDKYHFYQACSLLPAAYRM